MRKICYRRLLFNSTISDSYKKKRAIPIINHLRVPHIDTTVAEMPKNKGHSIGP